MSKEGVGLDRQEWDFEMLESDDDVLPCWLWEFFREVCKRSKLVTKAVSLARKGRKKNERGLLGNPSDMDDFPWIVQGLAMYPACVWPTKTFLSSEPSKRSEVYEQQSLAVSQDYLDRNPLWHVDWNEAIQRAKRSGGGVCWNLELPYESEVRGRDREGNRPKETIVPLRIDWSQSNTTLTKQFKEWVEAYRGEFGLEQETRVLSHEQRIRSFRSELKALGALRLLETYRNAGNAIRASERMRNPKVALFNGVAEWSEAKSKAERILKGLISAQEFLAKVIVE